MEDFSEMMVDSLSLNSDILLKCNRLSKLEDGQFSVLMLFRSNHLEVTEKNTKILDCRQTRFYQVLQGGMVYTSNINVRLFFFNGCLLSSLHVSVGVMYRT